MSGDDVKQTGLLEPLTQTIADELARLEEIPESAMDDKTRLQYHILQRLGQEAAGGDGLPVAGIDGNTLLSSNAVQAALAAKTIQDAVLNAEIALSVENNGLLPSPELDEVKQTGLLEPKEQVYQTGLLEPRQINGKFGGYDIEKYLTDDVALDGAGGTPSGNTSEMDTSLEDQVREVSATITDKCAGGEHVENGTCVVNNASITQEAMEKALEGRGA